MEQAFRLIFFRDLRTRCMQADWVIFEATALCQPW